MPAEHQGKVWRQALDKRGRPRHAELSKYAAVLIGAKKKDIQEELEIDLNEEKETENTAELFKELRIKRRTSASETTIERRVSRQDRTAIMSQEVRRLSREEASGRGGKVGARRQQLWHLLLQQ
jgi:hypothetical protein